MTESLEFPRLQLEGPSLYIGQAHGESLRHDIEAVVDFYRGIWQLGKRDIKRRGESYAAIVADFSPSLHEEICGIASGSGLEPCILFALNARSELFNNSVAECTVVYDAESRILAQNWDWSKTLEDLLIELVISKPEDLSIRTLTEPGIVGKVGMNSAGLGVCLNILSWPESTMGVPVHVLLRAILECQSVDEARQLVEQNSSGKASHILVADAEGSCVSVEFCGDAVHWLQNDTGRVAHTNHYLAAPELNLNEAFPSSYERWEKASNWQGQKDGLAEQGIRALLLEQDDGEFSVCKPWTESLTPGFGEVGTVFTLMMKLDKKEMSIRRGCKPAGAFYSRSFNQA